MLIIRKILIAFAKLVLAIGASIFISWIALDMAGQEAKDEISPLVIGVGLGLPTGLILIFMDRRKSKKEKWIPNSVLMAQLSEFSGEEFPGPPRLVNDKIFRDSHDWRKSPAVLCFMVMACSAFFLFVFLLMQHKGSAPMMVFEGMGICASIMCIAGALYAPLEMKKLLRDASAYLLPKDYVKGINQDGYLIISSPNAHGTSKILFDKTSKILYQGNFIALTYKSRSFLLNEEIARSLDLATTNRNWETVLVEHFLEELKANCEPNLQTPSR